MIISLFLNMTKATAFHFSNFARESSFFKFEICGISDRYLSDLSDLPTTFDIYTEQTYNPSSLLHITTHDLNLHATYPPQL